MTHLEKFHEPRGAILAGGSRDFGQQLDSIQGCRHTDSFAVCLLDADHGGLAEGPTAGAEAEVIGQHDHQFELGTGLERAIGVEENSAGTEIAGQALMRDTVGLAQLDGKLYGFAGFGAALGSFVFHFSLESLAGLADAVFQSGGGTPLPPSDLWNHKVADEMSRKI